MKSHPQIPFSFRVGRYALSLFILLSFISLSLISLPISLDSPTHSVWAAATKPKVTKPTPKSPKITPAKAAKTAPTKPSTSDTPTSNLYTTVSPIDLLKEPQRYLNQKVSFEGIFSNFSSLGLDYKKAFRDSKEHISFIIRRPDVSHHTIPLSELKLIYPRKKSEEILKLESGDKIAIKGQVFSAALNEPWLDITEVKILEKVKPSKDEPCTTHDC